MITAPAARIAQTRINRIVVLPLEEMTEYDRRSEDNGTVQKVPPASSKLSTYVKPKHYYTCNYSYSSMTFTTIQISSSTKQLLTLLKERTGAETYDALVSSLASERADISKSLFGKAKGLRWNKHTDRMDI